MIESLARAIEFGTYIHGEPMPGLVIARGDADKDRDARSGCGGDLVDDALAFRFEPPEAIDNQKIRPARQGLGNQPPDFDERTRIDAAGLRIAPEILKYRQMNSGLEVTHIGLRTAVGAGFEYLHEPGDAPAGAPQILGEFRHDPVDVVAIAEDDRRERLRLGVKLSHRLPA